MGDRALGRERLTPFPNCQFPIAHSRRSSYQAQTSHIASIGGRRSCLHSTERATPRELRKRVGSLDQVGGVRKIELADGPERGVEAFEFRTGGGLDFTVFAGRGMDIGAATYRSYPLAWVSQTGVPAASFFEPEGLGWLRGFHGGLIATCGLTYAGAAGPDGDEELGLHGRISNLPAKNLSHGASWHDDSYIMYAQGEMREASVFGPNMVMTRRVSSILGHPMLHVQDVVENQGFRPQEHMLVYHCNFGFPLMDENTILVAPDAEVRGQTDFAHESIDSHANFAEPTRLASASTITAQRE